MNRKSLYNEITSLGLQTEVKSRYGRNYTQCTNEQLKAVVEQATTVFKPVDIAGYSPFDKLVEILAKKKILLKSEIKAIMNA